MIDPENAITITDDDGVTWEPAAGPHGELGFRATHEDGRVRFVFLNVSGGSDDGTPTVFVYLGDGSMDAAEGAPMFWLGPFHDYGQ